MALAEHREQGEIAPAFLSYERRKRIAVLPDARLVAGALLPDLRLVPAVRGSVRPFDAVAPEAVVPKAVVPEAVAITVGGGR